jgi:LPXTG-motif cell wall-anchored protein
MPARRATALLTIVAALLAPAAARADGDPASDVLLLQAAYLPYFPAPAKPLSQTLQRLLDRTGKAGYPMKVALIQSQGDLGAYPELFGKPAPYAKLLASEIAFKVKRPHLLVVMPVGLAGRNLGPQADALLAKVQVDKTAKSDGLVRAAIEAVARVATANGHPTQVPAVKSEKAVTAKTGGDSHTLLYVLAGVIVLLGIALIAVSVRTRRSAEDVLGERDDDGDGAAAGEHGGARG